MLNIQIKEKLAKAIKENNFFRHELEKTIEDSADLIIIPQYRREAPTDKGFLRRNIKKFKINPLRYTITTIAHDRGYRYPIAIHEGTGRYRGQADYGRHNYARERGYTNEDRIRFAMMRKKGIELSIRPNKFALRAYRESEPRVISFIRANVLKLLKKNN